MTTFLTNIHPSFAESARRRGYSFNAGSLNREAEIERIEKEVARLASEVEKMTPEFLRETIEKGVEAAIAPSLAMYQKSRAEAEGYRLNLRSHGADEWADYDLNALMEDGQ